MKKLITQFTKKVLLAFLVVFGFGSVRAQIHQIELSMQNLTNPTSTTVEFELWIKNLTVDSISNLSFLQFGMDIPPAILNGGTISFSKIAWNTNLPASQQAQTSGIAVTGQPAAPHIRAASQTTTSGLAYAISSTGNGTYYATYRITNTQPFTANSVLTFTPVVNTVSGKQRTLIASYVNGATSGGSAFSVLGSTPVQTANRQLVISPLPTITLNQPTSTCPTAGSAIVTDPTCFGGLGSAVVTLTPNPTPATGNYSIDGGAATPYTANPFTVSGLSQGSHTITVTNDPNCTPFDVVLTVGGPSAPPPPPALACYQTATFNSTTCQWDVTGSMPTMPSLACYQTASFNTTTCVWDVTGSMPAMPNLSCYQTASFNTTTCVWDVTGSMPAMPSLACYETASFNTTTCVWDVTGSMPAMPSLACYETASFNSTTCQWDVTGSMPAMPSLACYQTASFNTTTCQWDVTGTQPAAPTGLACYETASFNNTTCQWDVTGSMPAMPSLACYQTASFNTTTCQWDVTGSPNAPITTTFSGCDSYTWSVNNQTYTTSGTYTVNLACQDYILYLTLGQSTSSTITINAPLSYTWACDNTTYTTSGTYTCSGTNASGCPDVQTLILTIGGCNLNVTAANVTGCPNSPITLSGSPAGGTFSVANPYTGPSTTYTYSYTDPNTGCSGTATGTITVVSVASVTITSVVVTGPSSVTVNWNQVPGLGWYGVRYRPINSATWSPEQTQAAPAASKNLVGLQAGTTYEIEVRGHCSLGNAGPWGSNTVFTTAAPCGTPSGLFAAPVTGTTAKLNWAVVPGATWYQVRYRKVGVSAWSSGGTALTNSKSYTGLSLSTQYEWQVRSVCGIATGPWSATDNFTTLASKQEVDLNAETINNQVSVYPNPVRDNLNVEISSDVAQNTVVKVFDMSGRLIKQIQANAEIGITTLTVNLSDVAAGMYQVQVFANDQLTHISKVNKQD